MAFIYFAVNRFITKRNENRFHRQETKIAIELFSERFHKINTAQNKQSIRRFKNFVTENKPVYHMGFRGGSPAQKYAVLIAYIIYNLII